MSEGHTITPDVVYGARSLHLFVRRLGVDLSDDAPVTMRSIVEGVARRHGLRTEDLKGPARVRQMARARQEAMWIMVRTGKFSLPQIGMFMGGRDHSTVWYAYHAQEARVSGVVNPAYGRHKDRHRARRKPRVGGEEFAA